MSLIWQNVFQDRRQSLPWGHSVVNKPLGGLFCYCCYFGFVLFLFCFQLSSFSINFLLMKGDCWNPLEETTYCSVSSLKFVSKVRHPEYQCSFFADRSIYLMFSKPAQIVMASCDALIPLRVNRNGFHQSSLKMRQQMECKMLVLAIHILSLPIMR